MVRSARSGRTNVRGVSDFLKKIRGNAGAASPSPRRATNTGLVPGDFNRPRERPQEALLSNDTPLQNPPPANQSAPASNSSKASLPQRPACSQRDNGKKGRSRTFSPCSGRLEKTSRSSDLQKSATRRSSSPYDPVRCPGQELAGVPSGGRSPLFASLFRATPPRRPACNRWQRWGECISTNLAGAGLRSVARNNKATRLLTRPGQTTKSSAKDLSLRIVKLQSAS